MVLHGIGVDTEWRTTAPAMNQGIEVPYDTAQAVVERGRAADPAGVTCVLKYLEWQRCTYLAYFL